MFYKHLTNINNQSNIQNCVRIFFATTTTTVGGSYYFVEYNNNDNTNNINNNNDNQSNELNNLYVTTTTTNNINTSNETNTKIFKCWSCCSYLFELINIKLPITKLDEAYVADNNLDYSTLKNNTSVSDNTLSLALSKESLPILAKTATTASIVEKIPKSLKKQSIDNNNDQHQEIIIKEYDFIIIGYGNTGRNVVKNLHKKYPEATIAIIDPSIKQQNKTQQQINNKNNINNVKKNNKNNKHIKNNNEINTSIIKYQNYVIGLNPNQQVIEFYNSIDSADTNNNSNTTDNNNNVNKKLYNIKYKYSVCIATGAHGAPIPNYLFDEKIKNYIYELKSTTLLSTTTINTTTKQIQSQLQSLSSSSSSTSTSTSIQEQQQNNKHTLNSEDIRNDLLYKTLNGYKIGIFGSGWDAIELAIAISLIIKKSSSKIHNQIKEKQKPILFYGTYGPLSHIVPPYLSQAINKRLKAIKIDINDRCLIKYIAHIDNSTSTKKDSNTNKVIKKNDQLSIYTAKSFDFMDGNREQLDYIIVAPETNGIHGNATIPTLVSDTILTNGFDSYEERNAIPNKRSWYQTWSQLSTNYNKTSTDSSENSDFVNPSSMIVCYKDDGRIAVNNELCACTNVYAVGSVAKYANNLTGHTNVAGFGFEDCKKFALIASNNMSRQYQIEKYNNNNNNKSKQNNQKIDNICVVDPIPIWRSDFIQYANDENYDENDDENDENSNKNISSALKEIGINALCIGNCDSERLSTHGIWWTNQSLEQRLVRIYEKENENNNNNESSKNNNIDNNNNNNMNNNVRKHNKSKLVLSSTSSKYKPVYGIGIIYYIDRKSGQIQGIMTWGLPFTKNINTKELNTKLITKLKNILIHNGGFLGTMDNENDYLRVSSFFTDKSKDIIAAAYSLSQKNDTTTTTTTDTSKNINNTAIDTNENIEQVLQNDTLNLPRPLHRWSEVKNSTSRNTSIVKRKDGQGLGIMGEDLYARSYYNDYIIQNNLQQIKPTFKGNEVGAAANPDILSKAIAMYDYYLYEENEKKFDNNENQARPPKEDPLWIRKGDEMKSTSASDNIRAAYQKLFSGGG